MPAAAGFSNLGRGKSTEAKNEDYTSTHSIHSSRTLLFQASALPAMLDFRQLYHGTVLFSEKREIMFSIHVICIKERSTGVSSILQGRFPMRRLLEFLLHTHSTPHLPRKCLGNVFTWEHYKLREFHHRITPATMPGLSQEHSLCEQLQG